MKANRARAEGRRAAEFECLKRSGDWVRATSLLVDSLSAAWLVAGCFTELVDAIGLVVSKGGHDRSGWLGPMFEYASFRLSAVHDAEALSAAVRQASTVLSLDHRATASMPLVHRVARAEVVAWATNLSVSVMNAGGGAGARDAVAPAALAHASSLPTAIDTRLHQLQQQARRQGSAVKA